MKRFALLFTFVLIAAMTSGCSSLGKSLRALITGRDSNEAPVKQVSTPRFSENENVRATGDRQYKRMNRQKLEEEAELKADAGSLWVMEGQGAYLFSQNQMRMVGDLLNVKIEGSPKSQLQTKVRVIAKLLDRLDNPGRGLASQGVPGANAPAPGAQQPATPAPAAGANPAAPAADGQQPAAKEGEAQAKGDSPFSVQTVPTRIVEQLKDGSYRVRGMQPFMIGKREYKVIVTGIVRPEDFDDAGLDASRLLDPQFDIVSSKKGATL